MPHEILTAPLASDALEAELAFVVAHFQSLGVERCTVLFGFAWGERFPEPGWTALDLSLDALITEVARAEAAGFGELGSDDLFITFPSQGLEFRFCNDSDIHLTFTDPTAAAEVFFQRWAALGYSPAEWGPSSPGQPRQRLRPA